MIINNVRLVLENEVTAGRWSSAMSVSAASAKPAASSRARWTARGPGCCRGWWNCTPTTSTSFSPRDPKWTGLRIRR